MIPFKELPEAEAFLRALDAGEVVIRPDPVKEPVTVELSKDVLARFTATGTGWEARLDGALRQWLEEHPLPLPKAS